MLHTMTHRWLAFWAVISVALLAGTAGADDKPVARVVNCGQQVQSYKRGICANQLSADDMRAIVPGVSWFYNWNFNTGNVPPANVPLEFVPMAWSGGGRVAGLAAYLAAGHRPRAVLAINEPNLKGQAFISPQETAAVYEQIKAIADRYNLPTVGPQMALGSGAGASITAMDPIQNKMVTYTSMVAFLQAFDFYMGKTDITANAFHTYGSYGEMTHFVDLMHKGDYSNRQVWVTEYAYWDAPNDAAEQSYLMKSTDLLERTPYVAGYAWFKERLDGNAKLSLFEKQSGKLTPLGQTYVNMPVHYANLYYHLPGKLGAERYVALENAEIQPTTDTDGFANMAATKGDAVLAYNVAVDQAGKFAVSLRVGGAPGQVDLLSGNATLATVASAKAWQTQTVGISLPAGIQTLGIRLHGKGQLINWINFAQP